MFEVTEYLFNVDFINGILIIQGRVSPHLVIAFRLKGLRGQSTLKVLAYSLSLLETSKVLKRDLLLNIWILIVSLRWLLGNTISSWSRCKLYWRRLRFRIVNKLLLRINERIKTLLYFWNKVVLVVLLKIWVFFKWIIIWCHSRSKLIWILRSQYRRGLVIQYVSEYSSIFLLRCFVLDLLESECLRI